MRCAAYLSRYEAGPLFGLWLDTRLGWPDGSSYFSRATGRFCVRVLGLLGLAPSQAPQYAYRELVKNISGVRLEFV